MTIHELLNKLHEIDGDYEVFVRDEVVLVPAKLITLNDKKDIIFVPEY